MKFEGAKPSQNAHAESFHGPLLNPVQAVEGLDSNIARDLRGRLERVFRADEIVKEQAGREAERKDRLTPLIGREDPGHVLPRLALRTLGMRAIAMDDGYVRADVINAGE